MTKFGGYCREDGLLVFADVRADQVLPGHSLLMKATVAMPRQGRVGLDRPWIPPGKTLKVVGNGEEHLAQVLSAPVVTTFGGSFSDRVVSMAFNVLKPKLLDLQTVMPSRTCLEEAIALVGHIAGGLYYKNMPN